MMSKVILLTDTHFGIKNGDVKFHQNMELFYKNIFFPYLIDNQWDAIIHLGDVFHDRRKIDTLTAKLSREYFFQPLHKLLSQQKKKMHIVAGNHDSFYRDTLDTNALQEFIAYQRYNSDTDWEPFIPYTTVTDLPEHNALLIPWITKNNREQTIQAIQNTKAKFAFGHLELAGFSFSKVQTATHGDDPATFSKFEKVFSGHYHYRHEKGNIFYLGSPTQQTWIDVDTRRGFHILDTDTGEIEFIENNYNIFENVRFDDQINTDITHPRYYRLIVPAEVKQSEIDKKIKHLHDLNAIDVTVIQQHTGTVSEGTQSDRVQTLDSVEDTPTFIRSQVNDDSVAELLVQLYNQAINEDVVK